MVPAVDHVVLAASLCSSILYGINVQSEPSTSRMVFKVSATALLAVFAATQSASWQLAAALALGSLGDAFLAWPGEEAFLRGLASFLVAHLFYVSLFASLGHGVDSVLADAPRLRLAVGIILVTVVTGFTLVPRVPSRLKLPIVMYSGVILGMVLAALTVENKQVVVGALLFAISDSALATDEFVVPRTSWCRGPLQHVVWAFYYSGQLLIAAGFVPGWDWLNRRVN